MPSLAKYRRCYFALLREHCIPEEDRHFLQGALTGKPSTKDWNERDWDKAVASLQRDGDQHSDRHAHVRNDEPAPQRGGWATDEQARYIHDLTQRIAWKVGPVAYICRTVLAGEDKALRRARLRKARDDGETGPRLWTWLTQDEADRAIHALEKAARVYPVEAPT